MVPQFGRLAQQVTVVGREGLRPVEEEAYAYLAQDGHALAGLLVDRGQVVPVLVQLHERSVGRQAFGTEGLGDRFERPDQQSSGVLLDVDAVVGVSQGRQAGGKVGHRLGDQVEVLAGVEGDVHTGLSAQLVGPHAGAGHHVLGIHWSLVGVHADGSPVHGADPLDGDALDDPCAPLLGRRSEGHGGVDR